MLLYGLPWMGHGITQERQPYKSNSICPLCTCTVHVHFSSELDGTVYVLSLRTLFKKIDLDFRDHGSSYLAVLSSSWACLRRQFFVTARMQQFTSRTAAQKKEHSNVAENLRLIRDNNWTLRWLIFYSIIFFVLEIIIWSSQWLISAISSIAGRLS